MSKRSLIWAACALLCIQFAVRREGVAQAEQRPAYPITVSADGQLKATTVDDSTAVAAAQVSEPLESIEWTRAIQAGALPLPQAVPNTSRHDSFLIPTDWDPKVFQFIPTDISRARTFFVESPATHAEFVPQHQSNLRHRSGETLKGRMTPARTFRPYVGRR